MSLLLVLLFAALSLCSADPLYDDEDAEPPRSNCEGDVIREILHHRGDVKHGLPKSDVPMTVFITLYFSTVTQVVPEEGYVELSGYMTQVWTDPRLRFHYSPPFQDVDQVRLNTRDIWTPDIELYNPAPPGVRLLSLADQAVVSYNGTVRYFPFVAMPVFCEDISDNVTEAFRCQLKIGSWSYDLPFMDVDDRRDFDLLMTYVPQGRWVLTSIKVKRNEVLLPGLGKTYADVTYTVIVTKEEEF